MGFLPTSLTRWRARRAPSQQGYVDICTPRLVQGWLRDPADPDARLPYRVMLDDIVLAEGVADQPSATLREVGVGDGSYAFTAHLSPALTPEQRARVTAHGPAGVLEAAPGLVTEMPMLIQGYVDQRTTAGVQGWLWDANDADARLSYQVMLDGAVLAAGMADRPSETLRQVGVGDGAYAFTTAFDRRLTMAERDRVIVQGPSGPLSLAPGLVVRTPDLVPPRFVGYVDARSSQHVAGWVWNEADPAERVEFAVLDGDVTLCTGVAGLSGAPVGDGQYGFVTLFPGSVADPARLSVIVRGTSFALRLAPKYIDRFEPISHVAMDIVDNCNLRCPFCTYDYAGVKRTQFMGDATFDAAIRLLPYVTEGNFWLSCLHEATIHPELLRFIDRIPAEYRDRLMYTTNLAKRMPDAYFAQLGASGMHHVNVSLESLVPETYERLRKGARYSIFQENWAKLIVACRAGPKPPRLRYNMMAYRSNLQELPGLVEVLLADKLAWQVEIRYTFDEAHIADAFRTAEYLAEAGWDWLAAQLAHHDPERVLLIRPPAAVSSPAVLAAPSPIATKPSFPLGIRIEWDGKLFVYTEGRGPDGLPHHTNHVTTTVADIAEPGPFLTALLAA